MLFSTVETIGHQMKQPETTFNIIRTCYFTSHAMGNEGALLSSANIQLPCAVLLTAGEGTVLCSVELQPGCIQLLLCFQYKITLPQSAYTAICETGKVREGLLLPLLLLMEN